MKPQEEANPTMKPQEEANPTMKPQEEAKGTKGRRQCGSGGVADRTAGRISIQSTKGSVRVHMNGATNANWRRRRL